MNPCPRRAPHGMALLTTVMILSATLLIGMGSLLKWSLGGYRGAVNRTERTRMLYAAESGCQYALASLQMFANAFETHPSSSDFARIVTEFQLVALSNFPPDIRLAKYAFVASSVYLTNMLADSLYRGMRASIKPVTVKVGIERIADTSTYVEVNQTIEARSFSMFEYGVFVDGNLTINCEKEMIISGPVHCNGILRLGGEDGQELKLRNFVTCASNLYNLRNPDHVKINYNDTSARDMLLYSGAILDSTYPYWKTVAQLQWLGRVQSVEHGVPRLTLPIPYVADNPRILIEPPNAGDNALIASARYANRAGVRIMENGDIQTFNAAGSNFTTVARISDAGVSSWIKTNKYFWNNSLGGFIRPLDIDVANFKTWAQANANAPFNMDATHSGILYVAVPTNKGNAVRLSNAATVPNPVVNMISNGFTVATRNPLYLNGDYNNISQGPACVLADSVSVLSSKWNDNEHLTTNSAISNAGNTQYYTAIMSGQCTNIDVNTYTVSCGAIESLPRYLEDWVGTGIKNKEIRGTIGSLWDSKYEGLFYYDPDMSPKRFWDYDPRFAYSAGAPRFHEFVPTQWRRVATR